MLNENCILYERYPNTPSEIALNLFYYPQWVGHFICRPDFYIDRSNYNSILFLLTRNGAGKLHYNNTTYTLTKGSLAIIDCRMPHQYYPIASENSWDFIFMHFNGPNAFSMHEHILNCNGEIVVAADAKTEHTLYACIDLVKNMPAGYEAELSKRISTQLYDLIISPKTDEENKITQVCDYIVQNYALPLSTQHLADFTCLSRCYFSTLFKRVTGTTPHDFLLCHRLSVAKTLLLSKHYSISKIAELTGFTDANTFIRSFKKKEGITPLQFAKKE